MKDWPATGDKAMVGGASQCGPSRTLRAIEAAAYARDYSISNRAASR